MSSTPRDTMPFDIGLWSARFHSRARLNSGPEVFQDAPAKPQAVQWLERQQHPCGRGYVSSAQLRMMRDLKDR